MCVWGVGGGVTEGVWCDAQMLREVRYGIAVTLVNVTVAPLGVSSFSYHIGNVNVDYSASSVAISVPGAGSVGFSVRGLTPGRHYQVGRGYVR